MSPPIGPLVEYMGWPCLIWLALLVVWTVLVAGLTILFAIRFNRRRDPRPMPSAGHPALQIAWAVVPLVIVLGLYHAGYAGLAPERETPLGAITVRVTGWAGEWGVTYENGRQSDTLHLPVNRPVQLRMRVSGVENHVVLPAFRLETDTDPGRATRLWYKPQAFGPAGFYFAASGAWRPAYPVSAVMVMGGEAFARWYATGGVTETLTAEARDALHRAATDLLDDKGCLTCHTRTRFDGELAPTLRGVYGSTRHVLADGRERRVAADDTYLERAIRQPSAEMLKGWDINMPAGRDLTVDEVETLTRYLRTLR